MTKGACLVGQSGGPTAVINASIAGVFLDALNHPDVTNVYGALNGLDGVIHENIIDIRQEDRSELERLKYTPSAILGSVRFKLSSYEEDKSIYRRILAVFQKYDIRYFFYVGGNDSMDTCRKISDYLQAVSYVCSVIGIPKTIDNDLVVTDHSPGYPSAAKYIATTMMELYQDTEVYKTGRVTIVEVMGRDAGWLTAASALASVQGAGPDLIYLPEIPFDMDQFLRDVQKIYHQKQKVLVALSEGIRDAAGDYILKYRLYNNVDHFGHLQLGGVGQVVAELVNLRLNLPIRAIELNLMQRCSSHHLSKVDADEAFRCGQVALQAAVAGESGKMVVMKRTLPYTIHYELCDIAEIANYVKRVPLEYIASTGNQMTEAFIQYAAPLIQGEVEIAAEDGLPRFAKLKKKML